MPFYRSLSYTDRLNSFPVVMVVIVVMIFTPHSIHCDNGIPALLHDLLDIQAVRPNDRRSATSHDP